ncbi:glycoside hydrolase N-terminal domain-containing protein [Paenibacillus alba]|uniref:Glycoside hydrolase N-terminal domain-containing protein n=1 Tax=Paenibacillus alba TaxID=1197127 RepID=A0ABU6GD18_9BACL|nr:glycoside hydrolase N-terminal domain-containing protein [Paenibacillus alba]MEC0232031.1 glycoside hydrolase N-terminal domain-containing protein [Paenibacillus alba]
MVTGVAAGERETWSRCLRGETFASHADDLIVSHLWSEQPGSLSFTLGVEGLTERLASETASGDSLIFKAHATETIYSNGECGVHSHGIFKVVAHGGTVSMNGGQIAYKLNNKLQMTEQI